MLSLAAARPAAVPVVSLLTRFTIYENPVADSEYDQEEFTLGTSLSL